jgi:PiT family inorganic phosphate transporter
VVGALASYSMGANNIANVMGMFVSATPFDDLTIGNIVHISGIQQLFFLGGLAIAVGIFTYGHKVLATVGNDLFKISPITGFAVVFAEFLVLTLFTSQTLETFLLERNLPSIPLVPLSATQSFIGAIIGVGLAKDPQSIDFKVFGKISIGWIVAPITAGILAFVLLFFVQNVFEQKVIDPTPYEISRSVIGKLQEDGVNTEPITELMDKRFTNAKIFKNEIRQRHDYSNNHLFLIFHHAVIDSFRIDSVTAGGLDTLLFTAEQISFIKSHHGKIFRHKIDFDKVLFANTSEWEPTGNKLLDKGILEKKNLIEDLMRVRRK